MPDLTDAPRVAYLFSRFPVVSQTFCDTEMLALEAMGFQLVIASLNPPPNSFRHERLSYLRAEALYPPPGAVLDLPLRQPPEDAVWRAMEALAADHEARYGGRFKPKVRARNAWHFARELRRRGVSHVHVHFANRATHTALFLKKAGFTFSFTAHAQDFMIDLGNDDLLREMIREAAFTVAVSDFSRSLLVAVCPDAEARIHRVYNGIDAAQFPAAAPGQAGIFKIVSVGRLIDFKGFPILLEAASRLRKAGIVFQLHIIGEGPQRPALAEQIEASGLSAQVRLLGVLSQEEIKRELAAANVFSLACLTDEKGAMDILPTVILEAMACGLPVVSTTLAGVPEMVENGVTGLLAAPGDAGSLAEHLAALAVDPALRARMGEAGRARVREIFALEKTAGHLARLLRPHLSNQVSPEPPGADLICLFDAEGPTNAALEQELKFLGECPAAALMASRQNTAPPVGCEFLPDAVVIESHWRSRPDLVARVEALRPEAGPVDGEIFYQAARRAVYLTVQAGARGWRRVHALRASGALTAWLLHRLSGLPAGLVIEADHRESRAVLTKLSGAFTWGSNSDPKLKTPGLPDALKLQSPPPARRILGVFKSAPPPVPVVDPAPVWREWLALNL